MQLKKLPDSEETVSIRNDIARCKQAAQEIGLLLLKPNITKKMWYPVVIALMAVAGLLTGVLNIIEGIEMSSVPFMIAGIAETIFSAFGVFFFIKKKFAFGYIAFVATLLTLWISVIAFTDGGIYIEDSIILSVILLVPCLLYLPFITKKK